MASWPASSPTPSKKPGPPSPGSSPASGSSAGVTPIAQASEPVVETSLLTGPKGSALVLVNYTYHPVRALKVDLHIHSPVTKAVSTCGVEVKIQRIEGGVRLELPLDWTDIVLLPGE